MQDTKPHGGIGPLRQQWSKGYCVGLEEGSICDDYC